MRGPGDSIALGKLSLPFQLICNTHASEAIAARTNCNDILHIPLNTVFTGYWSVNAVKCLASML